MLIDAMPIMGECESRLRPSESAKLIRTCLSRI